LSANLRTEERLSIEAQYRKLIHEWPRAIQLYRTLADLYPDSLDYELGLAAAQTQSGAPKDALVTLQASYQTKSVTGDDPRIDLAKAVTLNELGDLPNARQAAAKAIEMGKSQHAQLVVAQANRTQSWTLERLGELDHAVAGLTEAKVLFAAAGDLESSASTLLVIGHVLYDKADYEVARRQFEEALLLYRQIGSRPRMAPALHDIGNALYEEGKLAEARTYYGQALAIDREIGSKLGIASDVGSIANVLLDSGDLAGAEKMQRQDLKLWSAIRTDVVLLCNLTLPD